MRLHIVAIMPTHIHVVVHSNSAEGAESLRFLKGSSAHDLGPREEGRWWTRGGSARLLIDTPSIRSAIEYVRLQDNPLLVWTNTAVANPPAG